MSVLDYFISGKWIKKAPAQEGERPYIVNGKVTENLANMQTMDEVCAIKQAQMAAEDARSSEWVSVGSMTMREEAPVTADEVQYTAEPTTYNVQPHTYLPDFERTDHPKLEEAPKEVTELPIWGLPTNLQQVVEEVATELQCHRDFVLGSMMGAAATMMGKRVTWHFGEHTNHATLWIQLIGDSSDGKTPISKFFLKPVRQLEIEAMARYRQELQAWKQKKPEERGDAPIHRHRVLGDTTNESMWRELEVNGDMAICNDELDNTLKNWFRYNGDDGTVTKLNSTFNYEDLPIGRISSEPLLIREPNINIFGGVQPDIYKKLLGGRGFELNGFFQRFLCVFPRPSYKKPFRVPHISASTKDLWDNTIQRLAHIENLVLSESQESQSLHIAAINKWNDEINAIINNPDLSSERSLLGKMPIHLCRWAIVVTVLSGQNVITADIMRYSIECMQYFRQCNEKALLLLLNGETTKKEPTTAELIKILAKRYPKMVKKKVAEGLGISRQTFQQFFD